MLGAAIGDIAGSRFEFDNCRRTDFEFFHPDCGFTDDTVCTAAVADWVARGCGGGLAAILQDWCSRYPHPKGSYGGMFGRWIHTPDPQPYNSWGNGSAMRVSAVGWAFGSLDEVLHYAAESAAVTHSHPEGIKGAQAVAAAVFWARTGKSKDFIRDAIRCRFAYPLHEGCDAIRAANTFDESCMKTVPDALAAFFESENFEHAVRLAVSLGGDSDTIAAIAGSIAEACYRDIPEDIVRQTLAILPGDIARTLLAVKEAAPPV
ncbi:ADP-ribosyl-[dinitrogen reductase] hydrolase [Kingella potus]|uniref:ADP-ribosyl-[dinitrogen reductase] hydrolase n=1 Tax=Kingella potus TaxID=265175 RepID=A0A377R3F9_9NEIS|nr:ADP-ribosylglycohydrolase family protein [Kingella potus]UOP00581.1 ADP-ribosylglycohydrolase family protein [Kingella potus]STR03026.1 ADP-ribosyl-[dinitrogen reductase] hydrolase [Kingella potus]